MDSIVPTFVLIDIPFYVWFNCRYIGLMDYADILGYLIIHNPLDDHWQTYHLSFTYTTCSPFNVLFYIYIYFPLLTLYYLFVLYLYPFFVLLLKIREGVVLHMGHTYNTCLHTVPVSCNNTNTLIIVFLSLLYLLYSLWDYRSTLDTTIQTWSPRWQDNLDLIPQYCEGRSRNYCSSLIGLSRSFFLIWYLPILHSWA